MTQPHSIRDSDGSLWLRSSDGTYRLQVRDAFLAATYQGYTEERIRDEFGIIGRSYDDHGKESDYRYLRTR